MKTMRWLVVVLIASAGVCGLPTYAQEGAQDAEVDRVRLEQRLASVETLIERSSAARQIDASGVADAQDQRAKAREIYRQARAAYDSGQYARASQLLPQASTQMIKAVRLAAPDQITEPLARREFEARLDSVNALHAALRRVAAEKRPAAGVAETSRQVEQLIGVAQRLAGEGRIEAARAELNRAYLIAKAAVSSLRSGDTLVRSLLFASKEEEYRYEVDRNDTHQMLISVLLDGKPLSAQTRGYVDRAAQLRAQAEDSAARADHAGAIRILEESTRELVRGIRGAGVYIPG